MWQFGHMSFDHCQGLMYRMNSNSPFCCIHTEAGEPFYLAVTLCPWHLQSLRAVEDTDTRCHHANITFTHTHTHACSDINVIKKHFDLDVLHMLLSCSFLFFRLRLHHKTNCPVSLLIKHDTCVFGKSLLCSKFAQNNSKNSNIVNININN